MSALQMWLPGLIGWLDRQEREALAYPIEENRILRTQLGGRRCRSPKPHTPALATRAEPAMLDHGCPRYSDGSAPDAHGEPPSKSRLRELGAAAAIGGLPSHPSEADRS